MEKQQVNTKNLLTFIYGQMDKLDRKEIDPNTACAQAKLASQASNILNYELKRTIVQLKLREINQAVELPELREVEGGLIGDGKSEEENKSENSSTDDKDAL